MHEALDASLLNSSYFERARLGEMVMRRAGLLLFITALGLRLWGLDAHGLWYDETISVETAQHGLDAIFNQRFGWVGNQTPLHYLIVWLTIQPVDPTVTTLLVRLPSALAGALLVVLTYGLGRMMFGNWQGLLAGTLVALSTTALDYSQDLRPYSLATVLLVFAVYCLVKIGRPAGGQPSRVWWALFALSLAGAMYTSYALSIMALPSLALCCVWAWWRWNTSVAGKGWRLRLWPALMLAVLGACLVPAALDLLKIPGAPFKWELLTLPAVSSALFNVWTWFTRFGLPSNIEIMVRITMLLLVGVGIYGGIYKARANPSPRFGLWICVLFLFFPVSELILYSLSRQGVPRYILFVLPFYYLLVANGAHLLSSAISRLVNHRGESDARGTAPGPGMLDPFYVPLIQASVAGILVLVFALGYYNYSTPGGYTTLAPTRFDFRDAYRMLKVVASPDDTIIIANDPQHGETISDFYWLGSPPTATYSVLDPRLLDRVSGGALYWVIANWDIDRIVPALASDSRWQAIYDNGRVLVLKEATPAGGDIGASLKYMGDKLNDVLPEGRLTYGVRGMAYEAAGDLHAAAEVYKQGGTSGDKTIGPNLGTEFLNTAIGFGVRGDWYRAWREALAARLEHASSPQVYRWLAQRLDAEGYTALARQQEALARLLGEGY